MNNMSMNVKGAVGVAMDYIRSLDDLLPSGRLRLEETIKQDDGHWLITLSYREPESFDERTYKVIEIDPDSKQVLAMRIRPIQMADSGQF